MEDRYPIVPMTMFIELMIQAAQKLVPEKKVIQLRNIVAYKWLAVEPPVDIDISCEFIGNDQIKIRISEYAKGILIVADDYPPCA